jgi:hypothetical protein
VLKSKTVFVVGAGASAEVGLPVGSRLTQIIADGLKTNNDGYFKDVNINRAMHLHGSDCNEASRHLREAMPLAPSIDNYLHTHQQDAALILLGKLSITSAILAAEKVTALWVDRSNAYNIPGFARIDATWYVRLWHMLSTGVGVDQIDTIFSNAVFVVFNYDRCVEQFLFEALKTYYLLTGERASELLSTLKIFHPYGQVGGLPALSKSTAVEFGERVEHRKLLEVAAQIKTFTERVEEGQTLNDMRAEIASSNKMVFLGFAFHEINMEILGSGLQTKITKVYGTRLGMSDPDADVIKARIMSMLMETSPDPLDPTVQDRNQRVVSLIEPRLIAGTCFSLFQDYSQSIGA